MSESGTSSVKGRIADVVCWTVQHSTEDEGKVLAALRHVTGAEAIVESRKTETHFHQPMSVIRARMKGQAALVRVLSALGPEEYLELLATIEARMDENNVFHFRLDKQSCLSDRAVLSSRLDPRARKEHDSIDVEVHPVTYPGSRRNAVKFISDMLHELGAHRQG